MGVRLLRNARGGGGGRCRARRQTFELHSCVFALVLFKIDLINRRCSLRELPLIGSLFLFAFLSYCFWFACLVAWIQRMKNTCKSNAVISSVLLLVCVYFCSRRCFDLVCFANLMSGETALRWSHEQTSSVARNLQLRAAQKSRRATLVCAKLAATSSASCKKRERHNAHRNSSIKTATPETFCASNFHSFSRETPKNTYIKNKEKIIFLGFLIYKTKRFE